MTLPKYKILNLLTLLLMFLSIGCARQLHVFDPDNVVLYPPPPDTARLQYLTTIKNSASIEKQRSGFTRFLLGELPIKNFTKPYGIAIQGSKIYICDTGIGGIEIIDLVKKSFDIFTPTGKGQLSTPLNCCFDDDGNLYVADALRKQVVVFDQSLSYIHTIKDTGDFKPTDVIVKDSLIFIANLKDSQVGVYSKNTHSKLYSIPPQGVAHEHDIFIPSNLFVTDSIIYVSDLGDSKVKLYTHEGTYISSIGGVGRNVGQFARNKGIAVDRESNTYVVDAAFENVQVFNKNNQLLMFFGGSYNGPGDMWLPAKVAIDYENIQYFEHFVDPQYSLKYLLFVTNQYGPDKLNVYGFISPKIIKDK